MCLNLKKICLLVLDFYADWECSEMFNTNLLWYKSSYREFNWILAFSVHTSNFLIYMQVYPMFSYANVGFCSQMINIVIQFYLFTLRMHYRQKWYWLSPSSNIVFYDSNWTCIIWKQNWLVMQIHHPVFHYWWQIPSCLSLLTTKSKTNAQCAW